ncbi:hypothetical protein PybrP1_002768 [[Pythium] brassicae (nom. inval.)]|nr:hypothetical protein PybrP1_002768 [[Pythium] brassicae (nom. inval.)]
MAPSPTQAHLAPENAALTSFAGFVRVGRDELRVRISGVHHTAPGRVSFENAALEVEPALAAVLADQRDTLKVRLAQATSLEGFARELQELVTICAPAAATASASSGDSALPSAAFYTQLMAELDAVGWHRVLALSDDLGALELETADAGQRKHAIRLQLSHGARPPACFVDAPAPFQLVWDVAPPPGAVLREVLQQYDAFVATFQAFWDALDDLDAHTCVLEPQRPTRATGRRRVALAKHMSVQLEVHPSRPRAICELSFFGNDVAVAPLRERWRDGVFQWDEALLPRENLEAILAVEFPSPSHAAAEDFAVECGICYCYRLEVEADTSQEAAAAAVRTVIPDKLCENERCNRPFHEKCLFDWLKALPTARQSFNTVFGECPYCREAISAKFLP